MRKIYAQVYDVLAAKPWLSAKEVAEEIGSTEGSVRATLSKNGMKMSEMKRDIIKAHMRKAGGA